MNNYSRESGIAKAGLLRFCGKISAGLYRPEQKLVTNMMYEIAASGKCTLTEIGRALEENIPLKKTVNRLSVGLMGFSRRDVLRRNYLKSLDKYIDDTTIYPIDESDAVKPYGVAMEAIHEVRDGSTGTLVPGYMTLEIAALTHKTKTPLPVYERVFSAAEPGGQSNPRSVERAAVFVTAVRAWWVSGYGPRL